MSHIAVSGRRVFLVPLLRGRALGARYCLVGLLRVSFCGCFGFWVVESCLGFGVQGWASGAERSNKPCTTVIGAPRLLRVGSRTARGNRPVPKFKCSRSALELTFAPAFLHLHTLSNLPFVFLLSVAFACLAECSSNLNARFLMFPCVFQATPDSIIVRPTCPRSWHLAASPWTLWTSPRTA